MTNFQVIPYWFLMLKALSQDHQNDQVTWSELLAQYFGDQTDIYHLMIQVLIKAQVDSQALVTDLSDLTKRFIYHYVITSEAKNDYLIIQETNEKIKLLDQSLASIDKGLGALGYKAI